MPNPFTEPLIDPHLPPSARETKMVEIMCKRVRFSYITGLTILKMERFAAKRENRRVNMVQVACAIKYASDNRHLLKRI